MSLGENASLTLQDIYYELEEIEDQEQLDNVLLYSSDTPYIVATRGSSKVFVTVKHYREIDKPLEVNQEIPETEMIELWSHVVRSMQHTTQTKKLELYEYIYSRVFKCGIAEIDSEGSLYLSSTLPTKSLSSEYCARYIAEFAEFCDGIDTHIAQNWDGLTARDEGPELDQGSTNHAEY
jgi:hypothetical protein